MVIGYRLLVISSNIDPKGVAQTPNDISELPLGHPARVPSPTTVHRPRVLPKVVPTVTERRRFQRPAGDCCIRMSVAFVIWRNENVHVRAAK